MGHNVGTETGQNPRSEVGNGVGTGAGHGGAHDVTAKSKTRGTHKTLKDDKDFTFPWQTVKHKKMSLLTQNISDLLKKEYGSTCTFYLCTSYCVEVTETQTGNKHNVTLKVGQNELTGNINLAIIVSLKCDKKKDVKKKGDKSEEPSMDLSVVKTEKDDSETTRVQKGHMLWDSHLLTLQEWSVIQKLRSRGKNKNFYW